MTENPKKGSRRKTTTKTAEREAPQMPEIQDVREADIILADQEEQTQSRGMNSVRAVEFGKLPTTLTVAEGKSIADLIDEGILSKAQEFYVNGQLVDTGYELQNGDAVVGAPRTGGGI